MPVPSLSPEEIANLHICTQLSANPDVTLPPCNRLTPESRLALTTTTFWDRNFTITVLLIGGSPHIQSKVQQYALEWNNHSSVQLQFVDSGPATIRVSFVPGGSWSYIGLDNLTIGQDYPTMNFGWLTDSSSEADISSVVLHEFGHALGCVHEHQSPNANIQWNVPLLYQYYAQTNGWSPEMVDRNIIQQYPAFATAASEWDDRSIMLYSFPAFLTLNGVGTDFNTVLSEKDTLFIRAIYPA